MDSKKTLLKSLMLLTALLFVVLAGCQLDKAQNTQAIPDSVVNVPAPDLVIPLSGAATRSIVENDYVDIIEAGGNNQILAAINFRPANVTAVRAAIVRVNYGSTVSDWTVNIGDSISNDGWGGDYADQSNDAECHVTGPAYYLYANAGGSGALLANLTNLVTPNSQVDFYIQNGYTYAYNRTSYLYVSKSSPYVYALAGQADSEGPVNYTIYVAINRVVAGRYDRTGSGVSDVNILLYF